MTNDERQQALADVLERAFWATEHEGSQMWHRLAHEALTVMRPAPCAVFHRFTEWRLQFDAHGQWYERECQKCWSSQRKGLVPFRGA